MRRQRLWPLRAVLGILISQALSVSEHLFGGMLVFCQMMRPLCQSKHMFDQQLLLITFKNLLMERKQPPYSDHEEFFLLVSYLTHSCVAVVCITCLSAGFIIVCKSMCTFLNVRGESGRQPSGEAF